MMRIVVLSDARGDIENKAKLTLGLLAGAIATNLEEMRGQMPATAMSETYHGILANALPPGAEDSGRVTVLADP
ncbi:hypothetical protein, partial [Rhodoplanes roseus]